MSQHLLLYETQAEMESAADVTLSQQEKAGKTSRVIPQSWGISYKGRDFKFRKDNETGEYWYEGDYSGEEARVKYVGEGFYAFREGNTCPSGKYEKHEAITLTDPDDSRSKTFYRVTGPDGVDYYGLPSKYSDYDRTLELYSNTGTSSNIRLDNEYLSVYMLNTSERGGDLSNPNPGVAYIHSDDKVLYNGNDSQQVRFLITSTGNSFTWEEFGITEDIYHELENLATSEDKIIEDSGIKFEINGFSGMAKQAMVERLTGDLEFLLNFYCPGSVKFDSYHFIIYWRMNGDVNKYVRVSYDDGIN